MSTATEPAGTLDVAMAHASRLLDTAPELAVEQAQAILEAVPNHPPAVLLLAVARRRNGDPVAALTILEPLARGQANSPWCSNESG